MKNRNRGANRTEYRGNWKFQIENSTDGYHGNTVHESFWKIMHQFGNRGGRMATTPPPTSGKS